MRIAIVHDWLVTYAGSERVLEQILRVFPQADLFSLIDFLPGDKRGFILNKPVTTSFIQQLPLAKRKYRQYLPLMPVAIERFDLSAYDLIISSSSAIAKGVLTGPDQLHICYLQARNLRQAYEERFSYRSGEMTGLLQDFFLTKIRLWDAIASRRPDVNIANSKFVQKWHYHRHGIRSSVIYPPVDVKLFDESFTEKKDDYYVTVTRFEPYKRVDLVIEAFNRSGRKLLVIGSGTQEKMLKQIAAENIEFLGYQNAQTIAKVVSRARAFVFSSREDFGIAPVEAQACGTPVIALGSGGARETIEGFDKPRPTGLFFKEQTVHSLKEAVDKFEEVRSGISPEACRENAQRFSEERFRREFSSLVDQEWKAFQENI